MSIYIHDVGMISALGCDNAAALSQILAPSRPHTLTTTAAFTPHQALALALVPPSSLPAPLAFLGSSPLAQSHHRSRTNELLAAALNALLPAIAAARSRFGPHRVATIVGTSTSGIGEGQIAWHHRHQHGVWPDNFVYQQQEMGNPAAFIAHTCALTGPAYVVSTACSSGAKAIASGARLLQAGLVDAVVCGGADAINALTVNGFAALNLVSAQGCNPLSVNRSGIALGEGAALMVLSREPSDVRLAGTGESNDAHHISAPDPHGRGAITAMQQALHAADCRAKDVDYINLHGTGTTHNDAMEILAVAQVFGANLVKNSLPLSSTKPLLGHTLGAAGAIEAALCCLLCRANPRGALPPHWWDGKADPNLPQVMPVPTAMALGRPLRYVLSNAFGFGGSNAALVLARS